MARGKKKVSKKPAAVKATDFLGGARPIVAEPPVEMPVALPEAPVSAVAEEVVEKGSPKVERRRAYFIPEGGAPLSCLGGIFDYQSCQARGGLKPADVAGGSGTLEALVKSGLLECDFITIIEGR